LLNKVQKFRLSRADGRIGRACFAASNWVTDTLGRAAALSASLSALDVLTGTTLLHAACYAQ